MSIVIVTGSGGLVGSEAVKKFHSEGLDVVGIDNDLRSKLFGPSASTSSNSASQSKELRRFTHMNIDIRDEEAISSVFRKYKKDISGVVHCAAQPSHDWAATDPRLDFEVNASATLGLLEQTRLFAPEARFIFMSSNKVYGDAPNKLSFREKTSRYQLAKLSRFSAHGINETLSIDNSLHSLFGVSKASADLMVQEYGKYFGMSTVSFRGGCLTGPSHQGAELHGFLSYLVKCVVHKMPYRVFGFKGKQVRDNIHSSDLVDAFWKFFEKPGKGEVYNIGGSHFSNISMLEAIEKIETLTQTRLDVSFSPEARKGDHKWYVSDVRKFTRHYPEWRLKIGIDEILDEMVSREEKEER